MRWRQVSLRDSQVLLDPGTTKNDKPRIVALTGELRAILEIQFEMPFVFSIGKKDWSLPWGLHALVALIVSRFAMHGSAQSSACRRSRASSHGRIWA